MSLLHQLLSEDKSSWALTVRLSPHVSFSLEKNLIAATSFFLFFVGSGSVGLLRSGINKEHSVLIHIKPTAAFRLPLAPFHP